MKYNKGNVVTINISVWVKHTSKEIKGRDVINLQPRSRVNITVVKIFYYKYSVNCFVTV